MCGIVGFLASSGSSHPDATLLQMMAALAHRGPDSSGTWCDASEEIYLAHRRLAIVDLSEAGHQPMASATGRYVISYNGEIYNHLEMRRAFTGENWRGHSDTETLLAAFERYGIEESLRIARGMFAFAAWDRLTQKLTLARDPFGEKPLYYGWQGGAFLFGSELKALRRHPGFKAEIDRGALGQLLRHNCVPAPLSIFRGIWKLPPGSLLTVSRNQREPRLARYYAGIDAISRGREDTFRGGPEAAVDELEKLLGQAVGQQMLADVPLGAFLSGGVDSSTVVALMQAHSSEPVRTFSIGFEIEGYNEAEHAKAVARHLKTNHTGLYVTAADALSLIPKLPEIYNEPFADSSQIPTYLVSALARRHVTVSLSGDGGDELFGGYNRYLASARLSRKLSVVPPFLRRAGARAIQSVSPRTWDRILGFRGRVLPRSMRMANPGDKLHKGARVLGARSVQELYAGLTSHWADTDAVVLGAGGSVPGTTIADSGSGLGDIEWMMAMDLQTYLPDDILAKVDRAAMAVSLESRVPFLDPRVVEFAWRLPLDYKLRDGETKWVLRRVLDRYVPRILIERPKMGFAVPIDAWLRGPLRDWAEALLDESLLRQQGYFDAGPVRKKWVEHLSGRRNWQYHLWDILMFQAWLAHDGSRG